jgi:hypothetical protein
MSVSAISGSSAALSPEAQATERAVAVMSKAQDVAKSQAEGLLDLVRTATRSDGVGSRISFYA